MSEVPAEPSMPARATDGRPETSKAAPLADSSETPTVPPVAGSPRAAVQPGGERGGPKGPEPTRYGDWEKGVLCFEF